MVGELNCKIEVLQVSVSSISKKVMQGIFSQNFWIGLMIVYLIIDWLKNGSRILDHFADLLQIMAWEAQQFLLMYEWLQ